MKRILQSVLGLLLYGIVSWSHAFEVQPSCLLTKHSIGVNLTGKLNYKNGESLPRHIYINCLDGKCDGFIQTNKWSSTRVLGNLRLDYQNANMAIMSSGLSEFRLDRVTRSFTWIENPYETSGKLEATCPQFSGTASDQ